MKRKRLRKFAKRKPGVPKEITPILKTDSPLKIQFIFKKIYFLYFLGFIPVSISYIQNWFPQEIQISSKPGNYFKTILDKSQFESSSPICGCDQIGENIKGIVFPFKNISIEKVNYLNSNSQNKLVKGKIKYKIVSPGQEYNFTPYFPFNIVTYEIEIPVLSNLNFNQIHESDIVNKYNGRIIDSTVNIDYLDIYANGKLNIYNKSIFPISAVVPTSTSLTNVQTYYNQVTNDLEKTEVDLAYSFVEMKKEIPYIDALGSQLILVPDSFDFYLHTKSFDGIYNQLFPPNKKLIYVIFISGPPAFRITPSIIEDETIIETIMTPVFDRMRKVNSNLAREIFEPLKKDSTIYPIDWQSLSGMTYEDTGRIVVTYTVPMLNSEYKKMIDYFKINSRVIYTFPNGYYKNTKFSKLNLPHRITMQLKDAGIGTEPLTDEYDIQHERNLYKELISKYGFSIFTKDSVNMEGYWTTFRYPVLTSGNNIKIIGTFSFLEWESLSSEISINEKEYSVKLPTLLKCNLIENLRKNLIIEFSSENNANIFFEYSGELTNDGKNIYTPIWEQGWYNLIAVAITIFTFISLVISIIKLN